MSCILGSRRNPSVRAGLLLGATLNCFIPALVPAASAADPANRLYLSDDLPPLGDHNQVDNPNQID